MTAADVDVIDHLAGIAKGSRLDAIRALRPQARVNAQNSFAALFAPAEPGDVTARERSAVASFVSGLHGEDAVTSFYAAELARLDADLAPVVAHAAADGAARGPYGSYPGGVLSAENMSGPAYRVAERHRAMLGRLAAAFEHTHMLVFHPRDARPAALQALLDAGWSTTAVVTLSQLVAFLAFQIRTVAGLRALAAPERVA